MPYLTPDINPTEFTCRVLLIPDDIGWLAIVNGALLELTYDWNFEQYGAVPVETVVSRFRDMVDRFAYREGICRVIGEIVFLAGSGSPSADWLPCDGASLLRSTYPELFAVIGTAYGAVDGTHFNVPDLRDRVAMGQGTNVLASQLGEANHTLTSSEMPTHTHSEITAVATLVDQTTPIGAAAIPGVGITGAAGGGGAHNNIQPSLVLNAMIVAR